MFCNKKAITSQKACQQCSTNLTDGENNLEIIDFKQAYDKKNGLNLNRAVEEA